MPEKILQEGTIEVSLPEAVCVYLGKLGELRDRLDEATGKERSSKELIGALLQSFRKGESGIDAATKQILGLVKAGQQHAANVVAGARSELEKYCDTTRELLLRVVLQRQEARHERKELEEVRRHVLREITRLTDLAVDVPSPRLHTQAS